jgi:uncharacterized repeat protein (TIGR03803 family)
MTKLNVYKRVCLFLLGVGTAIASYAQTFTTLVNFHGTDGANPQAALVQGIDGDFYGTTRFGGDNGNGTAFKVTPRGTLTALSFCTQANCGDGARLLGALFQTTEGNFYGTTFAGGDYNYCTVFRLTPNGTLTTLYSFCAQANCSDGGFPSAGLVQATDGNLYGTTYINGSGGVGTIFRITPDGTLTTLYTFCTQADCADGGEPAARLMQATNGRLYGTTLAGGSNGYGTVFEVTQNGSLTTLYSFCGQSSCADGLQPSQLLQAGDGNFYGTARYGGGRSGNGTVFRVTPRGTLTTLHRSCAQTACLDGAQPVGGLVQATDGNFYGTTESGGATGVGTVFKITAEGTLTTLHSFDCFDGCYPYAALVQGTDGNFYGTTYAGAAGSGTVFRLSVGLGPFVSLVRDSGEVRRPNRNSGTRVHGNHQR